MPDLHPADPQEQEILKIRSSLNKYSMFNLLPFGLGSKCAVEFVKKETGFVVFFKTLFALRTTRQEERPYDGLRFSSHQDQPHVRELPFQAPEGFEKGVEPDYIVPGSEKVLKCPQCKGERQIRCAQCAGIGKIETKESTKEGSAWQKCKSCKGNGVLTCEKCDGYGEILSFLVYSTKYYPYAEPAVICPVAIPDKIIRKSKGDLAYDKVIFERAESLGQPENFFEELNEFSSEVAAVAKSKMIAFSDRARKDNTLVRLRVQIWSVPIAEYASTIEGRKFQFWASGQNHLIHTKGAPLSKVKILFLLLLAGGAVFLVAALFLASYKKL